MNKKTNPVTPPQPDTSAKWADRMTAFADGAGTTGLVVAATGSVGLAAVAFAPLSAAAGVASLALLGVGLSASISGLAVSDGPRPQPPRPLARTLGAAFTLAASLAAGGIAYDAVKTDLAHTKSVLSSLQHAPKP
ncbi:MAG: hypothetical protein HYU57_06700 [Micavibrio aeruginosavorus]|nr:hypothetical protein [Micavibrio aeruginosavorus]